MNSRSPALSFFRQDLWNVVLLLLWGFSTNAMMLGGLEFFRHTEADRTLIAWETARTGNYLIPHLLGSEILTKPPLFYWMIAGAIRFFGSAAEWVSRLPSFVSALMFMICQYGVLRRSGAAPSLARTGALMLGSGALFFILAVAAEIDMAFGFLCYATLVAAYFGTTERRRLFLLSAYLLLAIAFLTKGPPALAFFLVSHVSFTAWWYWSGNAHGNRSRLITCNIFGMLLAVGIVAAWLWQLSSQVGWSEIVFQFKTEIVDRVIDKSTHQHGFFFYIPTILSGLLPWSPLLFTLILPRIPSQKGNVALQADVKKFRTFTIFHSIVVGTGLLMLSVAQGKSSRYVFPLYGSLMSLCFVGYMYVSHILVPKQLKNIGTWFFRIGAVAVISAPLFWKPEGVSTAILWCGALLLAFGFFVAQSSLSNAQSWPGRLTFVTSLLVLLLTLRIAERTIFVPFRNATRSIKPVAVEIEKQLPDRRPLYVVEMFDRWVVYYLERGNREVLRLTPKMVTELSEIPGANYFLLNYEEEAWRLEHLKSFGITPVLLKDFQDNQDRLLLVQIPNEGLIHIKPHKRIPTRPSEPYYMNQPDFSDDEGPTGTTSQ